MISAGLTEWVGDCVDVKEAVRYWSLKTVIRNRLTLMGTDEFPEYHWIPDRVLMKNGWNECAALLKNGTAAATENCSTFFFSFNAHWGFKLRTSRCIFSGAERMMRELLTAFLWRLEIYNHFLFFYKVKYIFNRAYIFTSLAAGWGFRPLLRAWWTLSRNDSAENTHLLLL